MYPELLSLGSFTIHSYGFLIVVGFLLCLYSMRSKAKPLGLDTEKVTDLAFWGLVWGLIGGRVLYVITLWDEFAKEPLQAFKFWEGGLVFYGGLITGITSFIFLTRRYQLPFIKILDLTAPSLAIAHAFGRLGCFAAGCCYGKPVDDSHPFAVVFRHAQSIAHVGVSLHPAQLYDAANAFILFLFLNWFYARRKFDGQVVAIYGMLYAIGRYIVEEYRGDKIRGFVFGQVSTSQFISFLIFSAALILYIRQKKKVAQ